jgi:hypothetical protein
MCLPSGLRWCNRRRFLGLAPTIARDAGKTRIDPLCKRSFSSRFVQNPDEATLVEQHPGAPKIGVDHGGERSGARVRLGTFIARLLPSPELAAQQAHEDQVVKAAAKGYLLALHAFLYEAECAVEIDCVPIIGRHP